MSQAHFQRLISSDDHVDLSQDQVKVHLHRKHHDSYDAAVAQVEAELGGWNNVEVNRRWRKQQSLPPSETKGFGGNERHPAFGRPGHTDPVERLKDMDTDGVEASSSYCEVSAFRYLYLVKDGAAESDPFLPTLRWPSSCWLIQSA